MPEWTKINEHIRYFEVKKRVLLTDFLTANLEIDTQKIKELLSLGAIHVNKTRVLQDLLLKPKDALRVHLYPKRYPIKEVRWQEHILYECSDFVVLNKPAKIPVPPTVDNLLENVLHGASVFLDIPLFITQRLDRGTTGVLVFAKTKNFQSEYNKLLLENKITKKYLALSEKKVPTGMHQHYISEATKIPKEIRLEAQTGFKEARLIVENSSLLPWKEKNYYESEIQLLTGRTHQIRAQFAYLNAPLLGDRTYGGVETLPFTFEAFALHAHSVKFGEHSFTCAPLWRLS